jgi:hypothetical protein
MPRGALLGGAMTENEQKQQLSFAFLHMVAARAGFTVDRPATDYESVDAVIGTAGEVHGELVFHSSPRLEVQLKATSADCLRDTHLAFPLELKNYEDLRRKTLIPRILVILLLPAEPEQWLTQSEEELIARRCAYWRSLAGDPDSPSASRVTVLVPRAQQFTVAALHDLMRRIDEGERP